MLPHAPFLPACLWLLLGLSAWPGLADALVAPRDGRGSNKTDLRSLLTDPARAWSANTSVLFPGSPGFADATERWTIFRPPTYRAAIRPGSDEDIRKVVRLPRRAARSRPDC
ncbi:hypothetical protein CDD83_2750 [Cordyceps sp. RAO-2017]|nr:hypothetical protein CDD83_2750 [Cordyceps sp. RAO-2017]